MADEFGIPQPDCAENRQHFMLGMFDVMEEASNLKTASEAVRPVGLGSHSDPVFDVLPR